MKTRHRKTDRRNRRFLLPAIISVLTVWAATPATAGDGLRLPAYGEDGEGNTPEGSYVLSRTIPEGTLRRNKSRPYNVYKTYGDHYTLDIMQHFNSYMACSVAIGPWQTDKSKNIKETDNAYGFDLQGNRLTLTFNNATPESNDSKNIIQEIWNQTELPQIITTCLKIITDGRTSKDNFDGVWIYKGQYAGQVQEQCPPLNIIDSYGTHFYKIYCGSLYCTLWLTKADDEKGTYILRGLHPDSFEQLSKEYAIERGIYEVSFKWEDENTYYLTYFSPGEQIYITEKWTRTKLPAKIIQALKDCGF